MRSAWGVSPLCGFILVKKLRGSVKDAGAAPPIGPIAQQFETALSAHTQRINRDRDRGREQDKSRSHQHIKPIARHKSNSGGGDGHA